MVGLAFGNLFAGPISDTLGRRKSLIVAMIIFTLASIGIVFVTNIWIMITLRLVQGLIGGAGEIISRSIASDMYSGNELTKFLSLLNVSQRYCTCNSSCAWWLNFEFCHMANGVYCVLTIFGLMMLFGILFKVTESLSNDRRVDSHLSTLFQSFKFLFMTPRFVLPMLIQGFSFILLFTYISASPFIVQKIYGFSPLQFSIMFASIGITLTISSQLTGKLVDYVERHLLLRMMTMIQILGVVIVTVTLINHFNTLIFGFLPLALLFFLLQ